MSGSPYSDVVGEVTFPTKEAMDEFFARATDLGDDPISPERVSFAFVRDGDDNADIDGLRLTWGSVSEVCWDDGRGENSKLLAEVGATARIKIIPEDRDYDVEVVVIKDGEITFGETMSDEELFYALLELCQKKGFTNDYTNEMLRNAVDSIVKEES